MNHFLSFSGGALLSLVLVSGSQAATGDEHWDSQFGWAGPGGNCWAVATHNGQIYTSGLGATTNVPVMMWDGLKWWPFAQVYGEASVSVYDMVFVGDTLYVGGTFTNVNGVTANGVAKWDGTNWSAIGFKGTAYALAADGGNLYVAGGFRTNLNGLVLNNVGRWDGANWSALGDGIGNTNSGSLLSIAASNGTVVVGGAFTNAGTLAVTNIARWDGANWSALGDGLNNYVLTILLEGPDVYAGWGPLSGANTVSRWNGASWAPVGGAFNSRLATLAKLGGQLCAGGWFTNITGSGLASRFATWNGATWSPAGSGVSSDLNLLWPDGNRLLAVGSFLRAGSAIANSLATWDGTNWGVIGTEGRSNGLSLTVRAIAGDGTNLYVGGSFSSAGSTAVNQVARFDGTTWHALGSGIGGTSPQVNAIAIKNNNVYVGGYFSTAGGVSCASIARWDGANWNNCGSLGGMVYGLAVRDDGVYAVGTAYNGTTYGSAFFKRWDGNTWTSVLNFNPDYILWSSLINNSVGMSCITQWGDDLYVGGLFNLSSHDGNLENFTNSNNILRYDGTYCQALNGGLNSNSVALAVFNNALYVSGPFTNAGGVSANGLARYNGNTWSAVGGGIVGRGVINSMTVIASNLYVGGTFTNIGGVPANRVACWNGSAWSALGSGAPATILAAYAQGKDVYVGGSLRIAGGKPSYYIGRWNEQTNFNTPEWSHSAWTTNRQFSARLNAVAGVTNLIEASTNLMSWSPILTNTAGSLYFTDPTASNSPAKFYRANVLP